MYNFFFFFHNNLVIRNYEQKNIKTHKMDNNILLLFRCRIDVFLLFIHRTRRTWRHVSHTYKIYIIGKRIYDIHVYRDPP